MRSTKTREAINEDFAQVARAHLMSEAISRNQHALGRSYRLGSLEHLHVREDRRVVVAGDVEFARGHPRGEHHTLRPRGLQLLGAHLMREAINEDEGGNQRDMQL
jgi:hypothetical protein